ncbi:MAG: hypothetical protein LBH29_04430, partial [Elusimicrobiota bacterium]|nr:hypothetical protein [Elusimicrobiota bacterium]
MKKLVYIAGVLLFAIVLSSCGGGTNLKDAPKITVIEKVPNISTPKWVERSQDFWEEKGSYFYRGMSEGMTNVQASRRAAEAAATTALAQQVKATVRNEFTNALESESYNSTTGGYLKDIFFSVVDNLTISGAAVSESFSEHISMASDTENKVYWRSYVLVRINSS